jgi:uncharacterized protein (DUF1697 family)
VTSPASELDLTQAPSRENVMPKRNPGRPVPERSGKGAVRRYALLLRGVNVGANNKLPMAQFRSMLVDLGCTEVQTYIQSGNAVFATTASEDALTAGIEQALEQTMGRPIATTLRTLEALKALVAQNPLGQVATDPKFLCVTFLAHPPTHSELAPLHANDWAPELFAVANREIYTWHPHGQARSPLAVALAKLPLRGAVTTRNWNTVLRLVVLLEAA